MTATRRLILLVSFSFAIAGPGVATERHALLIGAQSYAASVSTVFPPLKGPVNDLVLMQDTLSRAFSGDINFVVLSDTAATRQAILDALDQLSSNTQPGDEVIVYLSGHGAQLPTLSTESNEPDGLDEVFLPVDTDIVTTETGYGIRNHIRDTEIGVRLDRIQAAGGFVWLIVDSCHSGTMLRSDAQTLTPRMANLIDLPGGPVTDLNPSLDQQTNVSAVLGSPEIGKVAQERFVGFYAAAPEALAYEMPTGAPEGKVHGLFTISLAEALATSKHWTFSDLARETTTLMWDKAGPQPVAMYRGALDRAFGATDGVTSDRSMFGIRLSGKDLLLDAGLLQGIAQDVKLDIQLGSGGDLRHVFTTRAARVSLDEAILEILPHTDSTPNNLQDILVQEGLPSEGFADRWMADRAPALTARLSQNTPRDRIKVTTTATVPEDLVDDLETIASRPLSVLKLDDDEADFELDVTNGFLTLTPVESVKGSAESAMRIGPLGVGADTLVNVLSRMSKAKALTDLTQSDGIETAGQLFEFDVLRVSAKPKPPTETCSVGSIRSTDGIPPDAQKITGPKHADPILRHCDQVFLQIENTSDVSLDVSPLYVSADGTIFYLSGYPGGTHQALVIPRGATHVVRFTESVAPEQGGQHASLVLLAVPSTPGITRSFRYLATDAGNVHSFDEQRQTRSALPLADQPDLRYTAKAWHFTSGTDGKSGALRK